MRKNNIQDMTITEQIESIKEQMCNDYCEDWEGENEEME